jgi:tetratricopeptide (TPR) repeat protein
MPQHVDPRATIFIASHVACAALIVAAWAARKRWPGVTAAFTAFVVISLPMLGVVQNGPQIAADRYTYHAGPALALLASTALLLSPTFPATLARAVAATLLVALGALTWKQAGVWHDSERLWSHVLEVDSNSAIAHSAMASLRFRQNRVAEGMAHAKRSVELAPTYAEAHNDVGVGLAREGRFAEAAESYRHAIALQPTYDEAVNNLGVVLAQQGDVAGSIEQYRRALDINPNYADAHVNWGNALVRLGRPAEAVSHYREALVIRPDHADAHINWGVALTRQGQIADAAGHFRAALAANPRSEEARTYLDRATELLTRR